MNKREAKKQAMSIAISLLESSTKNDTLYEIMVNDAGNKNPTPQDFKRVCDEISEIARQIQVKLERFI